jgi:hypothetical protein
MAAQHRDVGQARLAGGPDLAQSVTENPDESLESFTPADGTVNYLYLGPVYKSLAPTPWVSMPKPDTGNGPVCAWGGGLPACKMADAVGLAVSLNEKAIKNARSLPDERVELAADITLDNFLKARVEVRPQSALSRLSDAIRQEIIPTKVTLEQDGTLSQISMEAKISKDNPQRRAALRLQVHGEGDRAGLPENARPSLRDLPDKPAVDDFYRRLGDLQGS